MLSIKKGYAVLLALLLLLGMQVRPSVAQDKATLKQRPRASVAPEDYAQEMLLDVNNITTWLKNDALFPTSDHFSGGNGSFPKGTTGAVFQEGIVWGGKVSDGKAQVIRVNGSTYATGLSAGPIENGQSAPQLCPDEGVCHVWRVHRDWRTMDLTEAAAQFFGVAQLSSVTQTQRDDILGWYEYDWENWPDELGAPYEERNGQPGYQPATDANADGTYDPEEGDIPGYPGADQTLWIVTNDLVNSELSYGAQPIGLEYQLTVWGYNFPSTSPLGNLSFSQAKLIYKGADDTPSNARIDSMFIAQFADPDVGDYGDDYAGTDTTLSLGYAYNSATTDAGYSQFGLAPAAVGWDFLQGPVNAEGDTLGMTAFVYFASGSDISDPDLGEYPGSLQFFNLMRGLRPRPEYPAGDPFVDPITGEESVYTLPGDPVSGSGWVDGQTLPPGDRRIVLVTGPFDMELGDTATVVIGRVGAVGASNLSSVTVLKYYDQFAQFAYDNDFVLPAPPPSPAVTVAEQEGTIVLNWGAAADQVQALENFNSAGFEFEGYNVYQLPAANSSLDQGVKVATFDKANLISTIFDNVIDEETGFVVQAPVQIAPNEGIQRYIVLTEDAVRSRPLANGVTYYYAVTSYAYLETDEEVPFRILESSPSIVSATPQNALPGSEVAPEPETALEVTHTGASTSSVSVQTVDASDLASGEYEVRFAYYNPYTGTVSSELAEGDTLTTVPSGLYEATQYSDALALGVGSPFPLRYAVFRGGTQVSAWLPQMDPAGSIPATAAPIVEGVQVYVPYVSAGLANVTYPSGAERWVTGVNWGGHFFFGGADTAEIFWGSELGAEDLETVVLEFQGQAEVDADGYIGEGAVFSRADGYANVGIGQLPVAAYAVNAAGDRRRLNISFVELDQTACGNMIWDMGLLVGGADCITNGGREYLFIHQSDYDGGEMYIGDDAAIDGDTYYAIWPTQRGTTPYLSAPFAVTFVASKANTAADNFAFTVDAPETGNSELLAEAVGDINVFPNPYMGFSTLESTRFNKFVTFSHLPAESTIRIFNLAGTMVRVIEHEGPGQFQQWDLTNQDGIPVASGVYLVHVDTPAGEKVLKLALVQEEQILQRY